MQIFPRERSLSFLYKGFVTSIFRPWTYSWNQRSPCLFPTETSQVRGSVLTRHLWPLLIFRLLIPQSDFLNPGMSAHFRKNLVFIATADGEVIRTRLGTGNVNETQVILSKTKLDIQVSFLSVDWLHDKLYLVGKKKRSNTWSIRKADLNGARLQTVLPNIGSRPVDFMADPYTG